MTEPTDVADHMTEPTDVADARRTLLKVDSMLKTLQLAESEQWWGVFPDGPVLPRALFVSEGMARGYARIFSLVDGHSEAEIHPVNIVRK